MKAWALPLLALAPCATLGDSRHPPAPVALEVHLRAPFGARALEWHVTMGDAPEPSTPYDVRFCSGSAAAGCSGLQITLRVRVGPPRGTTAS